MIKLSIRARTRNNVESGWCDRGRAGCGEITKAQ